jgi:hypothetical protein
MARGFQEVQDEQVGAVNVVDHPAKESALTAQALTIIFAQLSKKALIAISSLFTAAALFSAWWLWADVLPNPTNHQLVGVGMYALFILAIEFIRRR